VKQTVKAKFRPGRRRWRCLVLAAWATALAGCSSNLNTLGDPATTGGATTVSQARGEAPGTPAPAYPAVHDIPAPRGSTILTDYEQRKLENDLAAARRKVTPDAPKPAAKKPAAPQKTGNKQDP
jgi:hypothetical protein